MRRGSNNAGRDPKASTLMPLPDELQYNVRQRYVYFADVLEVGEADREKDGD